MKYTKFGNLQKLIAILILAAVIVCVVAIAVSGAEAENPQDNVNNPPQTNSNTPPDNPPPKEEGVDKPAGTAPQFVNFLTGLESDESASQKVPYAFVIRSDAQLYGAADAQLVFEIPCEAGETRLVVYNTEIDSLVKIGALAPTRKYINSLTASFFGIITAHGSDDVFNYSAQDADYIIDTKSSEESYYIEGAKNVYTTASAVKTLLENADFSASLKTEIPFDFVDFGQKATGITPANRITLDYDNNQTELIFSADTEKYLLCKRGTVKNDMINGKYVSFTNVFVLFADVTTYEKSNGVETIVNTVSGGKGYYATAGTLTEIRWQSDDNGEMSFTTLSGERLAANRGNSYLGFYKSSEQDGVFFE